MATSNEDGLVTETNHIINTIEDHENRIVRHDDDIKRLMQHINKLEEELVITQDLQMIVARIFSIKTQAISIQNHYLGKSKPFRSSDYPILNCLGSKREVQSDPLD